MGCEYLRKNRLLIASSVLLLLTFGFVAKELIIQDKGSGQNKLPQFEVTKKKIVKVSAEGYFLNLFSDKYLDVKIDDKTLMFTFDPDIKEKIIKLEKDDYIEIVYINNEDEKEKKIISVDILKEDKTAEKEKLELEKEKEDENKMLTDLLSKVKIVETEKDRKINFEIYNDSNKEQKLKFPTGQNFEVEIMDSDEETVYTYSEGFSFSQAESEVILKPKEKHVFTATTKPLKKGDYTVNAWLLAQNAEDLKMTVEFEEGNGSKDSEDEKEIDVQTKEGRIKVPAAKTDFSEDQEWFVVENATFDGSNLSTSNYSTKISVSEKEDVKGARWAAAEELKEEGNMIENKYKLSSDEFVFYVEDEEGNIHEIAVKNINGTLYKFETTYSSSWTNSRYEIEAMVKTIQ